MTIWFVDVTTFLLLEVIPSSWNLWRVPYEWLTRCPPPTNPVVLRADGFASLLLLVWLFLLVTALLNVRFAPLPDLRWLAPIGIIAGIFMLGVLLLVPWLPDACPRLRIIEVMPDYAGLSDILAFYIFVASFPLAGLMVSIRAYLALRVYREVET